jgi:cell wall-associated NlpC family hydrolase
MKQLIRVLPIAMATALLVPVFTPTVSYASPVDAQRGRVEDIVDELERLEENARRIGEEYVLAVDTKAALDSEIVESEARVASKEAEIGQLRGDLGEMAIRSFVGAGSTPLGPLFEDTSDLNAIMQRDELARLALSVGTVTTDELNAIVADLEEERDELGRKRTQAEQLTKDLADSQARTDELTAEYTKARSDAEAKLGQVIKEEEERRAAQAAARVRAEYEAQVAAANAAAATAVNNNNSGGSSTPASNGGNSAPAPANSGGNSNSGGGSTPAVASVTPPAVSSRAGAAVNAALNQQGVPYRYATASPGVSFDCSGLTKYAWAQAGVYLPHQSRAQYASIPHVSKGAAQPGDLIFFYSPISHVSVYLGNGQQVHAPNTGSVVNIATVNWNKVVGVGRPG